ncbi:hypothetical protein [Terriglobus roseus]|uniref:Uncharacterized protein n=1 Tax=Terriglobus roseus TaxID=392734 RepID=A0A1G7HHR8_9BACT|nr:hypothetical protein [Terriglobus roseus]SDE99891.1 hypothetical protein SAMN05444167_1076 [Terriglobus roseus]
MRITRNATIFAMSIIAAAGFAQTSGTIKGTAQGAGSNTSQTDQSKVGGSQHRKQSKSKIPDQSGTNGSMSGSSATPKDDMVPQRSNGDSTNGSTSPTTLPSGSTSPEGSAAPNTSAPNGSTPNGSTTPR